MLRQIHSLPGLIAALLVAVLALSGAILAVEPVLDRAAAPATPTQMISVGRLTEMAKARHAEIDKITKTASGAIVVSYFDGEKAGADVLDPVTGESLSPHTKSAFMRWMTNLHRSFLLGDGGRMAAGISAFAMLILSISGAMLLAARMGGWHAMFKPVRGATPHRLHTQIGRFAMVGLLISALTGCYMSLVTFEFLSDGSSQKSSLIVGSGGDRLPISRLTALKTVDISAFRELTFPYASDLTDPYTLTTAQGITHIDAATGDVLSHEELTLAREVYEWVYRLHTGQGLWQLALMLGMCALGVPVLAVLGFMIWLKRRALMPRIRENAGAQSADTIILVGSEGNATWGFAQTLHQALTEAGHRVHIAPMNALAPQYAKAQRMLILTATYGDGVAPASANGFLAKLKAFKGSMPVAVLGFGDRSFPHYCRYAEEVSSVLQMQSWPVLVDLMRIDRQNVQDFAQWGAHLGHAMGCTLTLRHVVARPKTVSMALVEREDYGADVQAPTAILRFSSKKLPHFEAGDLVGIVPPGSDVPRYYSLASSSKDGILEICVRKQPGGLCSSFLHDLTAGGTIDAFIRPNPGFRPLKTRAPLILIGAGAGIGPLMGFIRQNKVQRPVHLYWGGRSPSSDFLYEHELTAHLMDHRLAALNTAFSRVPGGGYVQDRLLANAQDVLALIQNGAQIMVCGGRDMASGVSNALESILKPKGMSLSTLKSNGMYLEDVY